MTKTEERLIKEALQGDHNAFARLLHPYRNGFLNLAYRMTGCKDDAGEVCQDALIRIYRHLGTFKLNKSFKSWSYKILVNASLDFLRKQKAAVEFSQNLHFHTGNSHSTLNPAQGTHSAEHPIHIDSNTPEKHLLNNEILEHIHQSLKYLSPKERAVFCLRDGEGLSIKETSAALGCTSMSVRANLSKARRKIRVRLEPHFPSKNPLKKKEEVKK